MSIQRMLNPIANKIVGSAIHVVTPKKQMMPSFKIARGIIRRGPKTMSGTITRKGLMFVSDPMIKGYFVFDGDDILGYIRQPSDIKKMAIPRKMKRKIFRHLTSKIKDYSLRSKIITHPKKQLARRLGLAVAGAGVVGTSAAVGATAGHKRGYGKGYESALHDVLRYSKSATSNMFNIMDILQKSGVSLIDLKKMSAEDLNKQLVRMGIKAGKDYLKYKGVAPKLVSRVELGEKTYKYVKLPKKLKNESGLSDSNEKKKVDKVFGMVPVQGTNLVREDLQPSRRKRKKFRKIDNSETNGDVIKKGLIAAASKPITSGIMAAPKSVGIGTGLKNVYRKGILYARRKAIRPGVQAAKQHIAQNRGKYVAGGAFVAGGAYLNRNKAPNPMQGSET